MSPWTGAVVVAACVVAVALAGCSKQLIDWPDQVGLTCGPEAPEGLTCVADGFDTPTWGVSDGEHLFIVERAGVVWRLLDEAKEGRPFLDIQEKVGVCHIEQGLLGLAFHPAYPQTPEVFVSYIAQQSCGAKAIVGAGDLIVAKYNVIDGFVEGPGERILKVEQPHRNHNGGHIRFGPDGRLWLGVGDGGDGADPNDNGQDPTTRLGTILAIDLEDGSVETKVFGVRNPWRFDFGADGSLWVMDVGENCYEEVNHIPASDLGPGVPPVNLGWSAYEGRHAFQASPCDNPAIEGTEAEGTLLPVFEYPHGPHCSITGGPAQGGVVWFGDFCTGTIWTIHNDTVAVALETGVQISSFGLHQGDVFVLGWGGAVYRVNQDAP